MHEDCVLQIIQHPRLVIRTGLTYPIDQTRVYQVLNVIVYDK